MIWMGFIPYTEPFSDDFFAEEKRILFGIIFIIKVA